MLFLASYNLSKPVNSARVKYIGLFSLIICIYDVLKGKSHKQERDQHESWISV